MHRMRDNSKAIDAYKIWAEVQTEKMADSSIFKFAEFLGDAFGDHRKNKAARLAVVNIYNPEVMEKVEKILGPHGKTYIKIMEAQQDETDT